MLFSNLARRNLLSKAGRRLKSTTASAGEEASASSGAGGGLVAAVATTFGTYMLADTLSNFLQHPTQKMDYGYFNTFLGREVDQAFWGTRTEHIVGVAGCLAVTDHMSQAAFGRYLGKPLSFASAPAPFVAHTFLFICSGVLLYCAGDAAWNPTYKTTQERWSMFQSGAYSTYIGSNTAWFEPYVAPAVAKVAGTAASNTWFASALLPATLAYTTVKGVGWYDWGNHGLNDHELKMNGLLVEKK